jgi:mannose-1-phosphate guanylyltransferase
MKAVVLVGGEGTRLRPLTETMPKPLIPLMDRASLDHVLDHLARHGVHEVVLSSSYLEDTFRAFVEARHGDPVITWITETEPLGTGGAIVNALGALDDGESFVALNGDILTDLDLTAMVAAHRTHGAAATIALTHVGDARPFGLVITGDDGRVLEFREKPIDLVPGDVNAGTYVLEPEALAGWDATRAVSIERDVFPSMISGGLPVFGFGSDAYWIDLGTPEKYLRAHFDILEGRVGFEPEYPAPFVAPGAQVHLLAHLGRWVIVGAGARVGADAQLDDCVVHPGAVIEDAARVAGSILGSAVRVGAGATVRGSVLAAGAVVEAGVTVEDARITAGQVAGPGGVPRVHLPDPP